MRDIQIDSRRAGALAATGAFLIWGFSLIYYRAVGAAPALEIVTHRVVWSLVFTLLLVGLSGPFTQAHLITFLLIWSGLVLFTLGGCRTYPFEAKITGGESN